MLLLRRVEKILEKGGFDYCECDGCFDIAASRRFTLFLKVLDNVDSFQETQANNLKIISDDLDATVSLVGTHTRREHLQDNIIYDRFGIPTLTPDTLENIIVNASLPSVYRFRGGLLAEIDSKKLREKRIEASMTQSELANAVCVTKKSIYEHEHSNKKASLDIAEKIEEIIGEVTNSLSIKKKYVFDKNTARDSFEVVVSKDLKKMGFDTDLIYQTPFNIVAHERKMLIMTKADNNIKKIEKTAPVIHEISSVIRVPAVAVTKEEMNLDIPSIPEKSLRGMKTPREIRKFIK